LEHRFNALFLTDGFEVGAPHWQITGAGQLRLGVCHASVAEAWWGHQYDSEVVFRPDQLGQWKHLATVFDAEANRVTHYVDGQQVSQQPLDTKVRLSIGNAELGNWGAARNGDATPIRNLNGRMDEFFLFGRALSAAEIQMLHHAGEPIH
jgi:hypothetical protein